MAVDTYSKTGSKASNSVTLPKTVFAVEIKSHDLIKQAYVANLANSRTVNAKTLVRGETRGGGKKPWRQKGTGRARAGSIRSPLWTGGAITFGPTGEENYTKKITKKSKKTALKQALTLAAKSNKISVVEDFESKDGKTKDANKIIRKISEETPLTIVLSKPTEETKRALKNISDVNFANASYLSVNTVLDSRHLIFSKQAIDELNAILEAK